MKGFHNRILDIDLGKKEYWVEQISDDILGVVLGGKGLRYATSPRGACHLTATFHKLELSGVIAPEVIEW